ncbi:amidohydrolase (plasmid) [Sphingobium sp. JS3065]|uniref:amidohydrolase family protein n=1 Tax=Sphingobium sp. JS3065 TaxID=2970925 RepID=UPI0022645276|nr:amidohydrolase family protein [Sphingobium sp. JS3065]UZW58282.1 amidohydrolase [Sphingobium sp. JS3065]
MNADAKNAWRLESPPFETWHSRIDEKSTDKPVVISCDSHVNEPMSFMEMIEPGYEDRLPRFETDEDGNQWLITEGWTPQLVKVAESRRDLLPTLEDFESYEVLSPFSKRMEDQDVLRAAAGRDIEQRKRDRQSQGVDYEIVFPQKGQLCYATPDVKFQTAMTRAYNRFVRQYFADDWQRSLPAALISPGDVQTAVKEIEWAAAEGFTSLMLPNRPIFHRATEARFPLEYNDKSFEPLWDAIEASKLPIVLHVSSGQDPRAIAGDGGAIINYLSHSMITPIEPVVQMISSGVFERHRGLRLATIESGIGWVPWVLTQMDHAYRAHHMWVRPVIPNLPSDYYREHCYAAFLDEPKGVKAAVEFGLEDNILWSSDYPHHEGSFPYCRNNMKRNLAGLSDAQIDKIVGGNATRMLGLKNATPET